MVSSGGGDATARALGAALKALRKRAGMTLAEAGDALEPETISGQAFAIWEKGDRPGIHNPDTMARLLAAVQADRSDLLVELRRLGVDAPELEPAPAVPATPGRSFTVRVTTRAKPDAERGTLVYDGRATEGTTDLAWLFGPTAGHLRMADDRLKGRVEAGQLVHYDRATAPRSGQVCVVEVAAGLHVYLYGQLADGKLSVTQLNPAAEVQLDLAEVRGVYAARLIGD